MSGGSCHDVTNVGNGAMELLPFLILPMLLLIAGYYDVTTMTIPNWISGFLILSYFVMAPFFGIAWIDMGMAVLASFLFLMIGMFLFAMKWLGGGDAKLLMATALWFGWPAAWAYLVIVMALGGVVALGLITFRKYAIPQPVQGVDWVHNLHKPDGDMPYGTAIALAGLIMLPEVPMMAGLF